MTPFDWQTDDAMRAVGDEAEDYLRARAEHFRRVERREAMRPRVVPDVPGDTRPVDLTAWWLLSGTLLAVASAVAIGTWLATGAVVWLIERRKK